jgi:hypothetical protein
MQYCITGVTAFASRNQRRGCVMGNLPTAPVEYSSMFCCTRACDLQMFGINNKIFCLSPTLSYNAR